MTDPASRPADDVLPLEHFRVLHLKPGDTLVLTYPDHLAPDDLEDLTRQIRTTFPDHKAVVLTGGMEIGVVRGEQHDGPEDGA